MEIFLFGLLAVLAVAFAVLMITSKSAIHSALFLVGNFGCIAILFLMLNAPFISMVQIAVYAGAIMVLFLFVIMLLGAEQTGDTTMRFRWVTRLAVILAAGFLIVAGAPLLISGFTLPEPEADDPLLRVVHAANIVEEDLQLPVNITLSGAELAEPLVLGSLLNFSEVSAFERVAPGDYTLRIASPDGSSVIAEESITLSAGDVQTFVAYGEAGVEGGLPFGLAAVPTSFDAPEGDGARVRVLNVFTPESLLFINVGPDKVLNVQSDGSISDRLLEAAPFADVSSSFHLPQGRSNLGLYPLQVEGEGPEAVQTLFDYPVDSATEILILLTPDYAAPRGADGAYRARVLDRAQQTLVIQTRESFGAPGDIGKLLFTTYLLPVNLVGFLLLVALIGVIVLARPQGVISKRRATVNRRRKVSRPLVSVISQQTGRDVVTDRPRLDEPGSGD